MRTGYRMNRSRFFAALRSGWHRSLCCAGLALMLAGGTADAAGEPERTYSEHEACAMLRSELVEFERYAESTMQSTLEILRSRKVSAAELKKMEEWQSAQLKRFQKALRQEDPLLALVDGWAVSRSLIRYMDQPSSAEGLTGTTRAVGVDMMQRREERLAYIASRYLSPAAIEALEDRLEEFTVEQAIPASTELQSDARWWSAPFFSGWSKGQAAVEGLFQMSLIPGRALKGVSESGTALSGIRETTAEAVQVINQLPANVRKEFQVALDDLIAKRSEIIEILSVIDSVSTNLRVTAESTHLTAAGIQESLTVARELLPAGESLAVAVERAVNASSDLVRLIGQDSAPAAQPGGEGGERRGFDIADYQRTAAALTGAAVEIRQMLEEIRTLIEREDGGESTGDSEGFEVRDYGAAADSIQLSAAEIRALLGDLRGVAEDAAVQERIAVLRDEADALTRRTAGHVTAVVDHLAVRLIQLLLVGFLLACAYALFQRKLRQR